MRALLALVLSKITAAAQSHRLFRFVLFCFAFHFAQILSEWVIGFREK